MIVVLLDDARFGSGPATVVAHAWSVAEYLTMTSDKDGARIQRMRLWQSLGVDPPVGARVYTPGLILGTGIGYKHVTVEGLTEGTPT